MIFKKSKTKRRRLAGGNREILMITYLFVALFIAIIVYLAWFILFRSNDVINHSYNQRQDLYAKHVVRGDILSREGDVLATTLVDSNGTETRYYPYERLFAHAVGYSTHGKTGVESIANLKLLTSNVFIGERMENDVLGKKNPGDNVITTLNLPLQRATEAAIAGRKGAVVVTNVRTGEVLSMVSKPDFDANTIVTNWATIDADGENSALLNRATQGLYPPGSTFKIVTALEYLKENPDSSSYRFACAGSYSYGGSTINCYHGQKHGAMDFDLSFAKSCNSSFANIGCGLQKKDFRKTCEDLLFNQALPNPYSYRESTVPISATSNIDEMMQTAIGQGKTMTTPFHINLITAAIANDGMLMKPYVVSAVESAYGDPVSTTKQEEYRRLMTAENAQELQRLMRLVVEEGTASRLRDTAAYTAGGKTGSAEFTTDKSRSHAWFTGFAGSGKPEIAITVVIEDGGSGGEVAVPIARAVFDAYFNSRTE